jgi:putative cell wall-binding protein
MIKNMLTGIAKCFKRVACALEMRANRLDKLEHLKAKLCDYEVINKELIGALEKIEGLKDEIQNLKGVAVTKETREDLEKECDDLMGKLLRQKEINRELNNKGVKYVHKYNTLLSEFEGQKKINLELIQKIGVLEEEEIRQIRAVGTGGD